MNICFKEFKDDEIDTLVEFLTSNTWEFFGDPNPSAEKIRKDYINKIYNGESSKTFWITLDHDIKAGIIRIYDLEDSTPVFDIRISSEYKGMGVGTITVNWLIDYIFDNFSDKDRIEANTRQDNYAMRSVFHKCGFVKEAHYRKAWRSKECKIYDAIGYGFIKDDWKKE
jgi:RimJ/RimL family protein N-acetyltransferase